MAQSTQYLLMIRPVNFSFNVETAVNNAFQVIGREDGAQEKALQEFNGFVQTLRDHGVFVTVVDDTPVPYTPDSIFPNNWLSLHDDGTVVLYPMFAANRRQERKPEVIELLRQQFRVKNTIDLSSHEAENLFLEGTGSMVLDRNNRITYACLSPRTDETVLQDFCRRLYFRPVIFHATDARGHAIYHTNVMMCVADCYVVICLETIANEREKNEVANAITESGKTIVPITLEQVNHFAGNMLQVTNQSGDPLLVMSSQAYESLKPEQVKQLEMFNPIIHADLSTIEANGGGSARCMLAEIFLPQL